MTVPGVVNYDRRPTKISFSLIAAKAHSLLVSQVALPLFKIKFLGLFIISQHSPSTYLPILMYHVFISAATAIKKRNCP